MAKSLQRTDKELAGLYERHVQTVYRVCFAYMKNADDAQDMLQETFVKLMKQSLVFNESEHEKAWLIRTAANLCKDSLKHWWRKRESLRDPGNLQFMNWQSERLFKASETLAVIMGLPSSYVEIF